MNFLWTVIFSAFQNKFKCIFLDFKCIFFNFMLHWIHTPNNNNNGCTPWNPLNLNQFVPCNMNPITQLLVKRVIHLNVFFFLFSFFFRRKKWKTIRDLHTKSRLNSYETLAELFSDNNAKKDIFFTGDRLPILRRYRCVREQVSRGCNNKRVQSFNRN